MADNLTEDEEKDMENQDIPEGEAHREGEFDDLRDMLRSVLDKVDAISGQIGGIYDNFTDSVAQMVENGTTVREDDVATAIAEAAANDLENLDYTL